MLDIVQIQLCVSPSEILKKQDWLGNVLIVSYFYTLQKVNKRIASIDDGFNVVKQ